MKIKKKEENERNYYILNNKWKQNFNEGIVECKMEMLEKAERFKSYMQMYISSR